MAQKINSNIQYTAPLRLDRRQRRIIHTNFLHKLSINDLLLIASERGITSRKTDVWYRKSADELMRDVCDHIRRGRTASCELTMGDLSIGCLKELAMSHGIFINNGRNKNEFKTKNNSF